MSNSIGDINLRILLDVLSADKNAKQFTSSLKNIDSQAEKSNISTVRLSDRVQNLGLRFQGLQSLLQILSGTFGGMIKSYQSQEIALAKLSNGLKNVGEGTTALNKLTKQASELQRSTVFDDAEINNAQAMLTTFMKSSEEIEILTPRLLDLASAFDQSGEGGKSLQEVAVMLGKVNEETIGALRRVGVAFSKEQEEKLKSLRGTEQAIYLSKILDQNFKGMAETVGNTTAGKMKIFQYSLGELKEEWGKLLVDVLLPFLEPLKNILKTIQDSPPNIKAAALALSGLGVAFVFLNGSLPGSAKAIGIFLTVALALPDPLRDVAIALGVVAVAIKLLGGDITSVSGLLGTLMNAFPKLAGAATSSAGTIGRLFGTGGVVVAAIGIAIWWVNELIGKMSDAAEEARQLAKYKKELSEGTFVPMFDEQAPSYETIAALKKNLDKDPNATITNVEGKTVLLKDYIAQMEAAQIKSNQFGRTWEEMTGQVNSNIQEMEKSSKELGDQIKILDEQLSNIKPSDPGLKGIKESRDALLVKKKEIDDILAPPQTKSGSTQPKSDVTKVKDELELLEEQYNSLIAAFERPIKMARLQEAIDLMDRLGRPIDEILSTKGIEVGKVTESEGGGWKPVEEVKGDGKKAWDFAESKADKIQDSFSQSFSFAQQLTGILGLGADSFVGKLLGGLQEGLSLANSFANLLSMVFNIGSGGIFGLLGLASGGQVPGSGQGDTVPAMLTPGEFVVRKSIVQKIGSGFFEWINGGGLFNSLAGHYANGGMVNGAGGNITIIAKGEITDALSFKVVDKGTKLRNVKIERSSY